MTVQQLIDLLQKVENKDKQIIIAIHQHNKVYSVAHTDVHNTDYLRQNDSHVMLWTWLPDKMYTVERKK